MNADEADFDEPDDEFGEDGKVGFFDSLNDDELLVAEGFEVRIETRISYVHPQLGIEVPLGFDRDGKWHPLQFVDDGGDEISPGYDPKNLIRWLSSPTVLPYPLLDDRQAVEAVRDTLQCCRVISNTCQASARASS